MNVLIDTNALLIPLQFKLDIYEKMRDLMPKVSFTTLRSCVNELKKKKPRLSELALNMGLINGLRVIETVLKAKSVDDEILSYSIKNKSFVFTQDKALRKKLLKHGLRVIIMRQKKYLEVIG